MNSSARTLLNIRDDKVKASLIDLVDKGFAQAALERALHKGLAQVPLDKSLSRKEDQPENGTSGSFIGASAGGNDDVRGCEGRSKTLSRQCEDCQDNGMYWCKSVAFLQNRGFKLQPPLGKHFVEFAKHEDFDPIMGSNGTWDLRSPWDLMERGACFYTNLQADYLKDIKTNGFPFMFCYPQGSVAGKRKENDWVSFSEMPLHVPRIL